MCLLLLLLLLLLSLPLLPLPLLPAGLELAGRLGIPISHVATLFSTPEDRQQLESLFAAHPYPQHRCFVRRSHGFFLLGRWVAPGELSWKLGSLS